MPPVSICSMNQNSLNFYELLVPFNKFEDFCEDKHYQAAPQDWFVLITDISGSTKAIQLGKYKEVNMAGAACIAAVLNSIEQVSIPYIFGGDGATFLIPSELIQKVRPALLKTKLYVKDIFGFDMRIGAVSLNEIQSKGFKVEVAKYQLSVGNSLSFIRGGGLSIAESMIKGQMGTADAYLWQNDERQDANPDLSGLSCRWQPKQSTNGLIVSMLVKVTDSQDENQIYQNVTKDILKIVSTDHSGHIPAGGSHFQPKWPPAFWSFENRWSLKDRSIPEQIKRLFLLNIFTVVGHLGNKYGLKIGSFDGRKYMKEVATNSDHRKFDDMVRMVIDCSTSQYKHLESYLESKRKLGILVYGLHRSKTALMTCLVFSATENRHIHFIDGSDGGFAIAAKQMKSFLKVT